MDMKSLVGDPEKFQDNLRHAMVAQGHLRARESKKMAFDRVYAIVEALPQQAQMKVFTEAMSKSKINQFELVEKEAMSKSKQHLPLARVRDSPGTAVGLFCNYVCNGCAMLGADFPTQFRKCVRCKTVFYCSKECQVRDWKGQGLSSAATRPYPRSHKDMCAELAEAKREFDEDEVNGESLRKKGSGLFGSWADQHHESGAFFRHEFLARRGVLGQSKVGFWAMSNQTNPYSIFEVKDSISGFINGEMLLKPKLPSLEEGWKALKKEEFPPLATPAKSLPSQGITSWKKYFELRQISPMSIAPIILTNVLTIYQMIQHELKLMGHNNNNLKTTQLKMYVCGPEVELNQVPMFAELAFLLPKTDLMLYWVSPAVKGLCDEAKENHPNSWVVKNKYIVLDTDRDYPDMRHKITTVKGGDTTTKQFPAGRDPEEGRCGRVRIQLVDECQYYHELGHTQTPTPQDTDAVLALNAGIGAYPTWINTLAKLWHYRTPFAVSDQTKMGLRSGELVTFPKVVEICNGDNASTGGSPMTQPSVRIKLNPFHGVIGRDVVALLVPNLDNGYLLVSQY
jgi:hypothetical protein